MSRPPWGRTSEQAGGSGQVAGEARGPEGGCTQLTGHLGHRQPWKPRASAVCVSQILLCSNVFTLRARGGQPLTRPLTACVTQTGNWLCPSSGGWTSGIRCGPGRGPPELEGPPCLPVPGGRPRSCVPGRGGLTAAPECSVLFPVSRRPLRTRPTLPPPGDPVSNRPRSKGLGIRT